MLFRYILEARKRALTKKKKLRTLGRRARSRDSDEEEEEEDGKSVAEKTGKIGQGSNRTR